MAEVPVMADRVLPVVKLFFPCDEATYDPSDEKWVVRHPYFTARMPEGVTENFGALEVWLYAKITDAVGDFALVVEMYNEAGGRIARSAPVARHFPGGGQLDESDEVFVLRRVPFRKPGIYRFKLLANHAETQGGTVDLRVLPG